MYEPLIPKIFHRTIPQIVDEKVNEWWQLLQDQHDGWLFLSHDEPIDNDLWPICGKVLDKCKTGAQRADLIRLEALYSYGGIYVDSDVYPCRPFDSLLWLPAFAAWEDEEIIPNAVMGAVAGHPAIEEVLFKAVEYVDNGADTWTSGVNLTTQIFKDRIDMLILPPGAFYPHHYLQKHLASKYRRKPWVFCEHMWEHSWGTEESKASIDRNQRA